MNVSEILTEIEQTNLRCRKGCRDEAKLHVRADRQLVKQAVASPGNIAAKVSERKLNYVYVRTVSW